MRSKNIYIRKTDAYNKEFHPFLQSKSRPNLDGEFHINSYGFRADEITKQKPKNTYRIVILGGSTAYEDGIAYENTAGKLLQDMLNKQYTKKIEVLNAGVSGYTSEHSLIDYMTRISDFKPDLVIMWHGVNDMYASCANTYTISGPYKPDYSHFLGPLTNMVSSYFYPSPVSIHLFTYDYALNFITTHLYSDFPNLYNSFTTKISDYKLSKIPTGDMQFLSITSYQRNLKYFITAVRSDNTKLILGNQPNMFSTDERYHMTKGGIYCYNGKFRANMQSQIKGMKAFNDVTKKVANENDVPFIDLDAALPRTPEYFYDDIHWTNQGNKIAAKKLYDFIVSGNFIQ